MTECVRTVRVLAEGHDIRITLDTPDGVQTWGDEELLRRMVTNLLDNAVRYSPDRSEYQLQVTVQSEILSLSVSDSAPAIPTSERERIFERFVRLETSRPTSGGGLGLPIARWIAEQHGGTLTLSSDARGNRFVVILKAVPTTRVDQHQAS